MDNRILREHSRGNKRGRLTNQMLRNLDVNQSGIACNISKDGLDQSCPGYRKQR